MIKQVIVMRKDLKMRRGKEIAQGAHASGSFMSRLLQWSNPRMTEEQKEWLRGKFTKICVQVNSKDELFEIHNKATLAGLESYLITDSGATEFNGVSTPTCCAIGPHEAERIDAITGHLKLY